MIPDERGPTNGKRNDARGWDAQYGSSKYLTRKTPYELGNPHVIVASKNAATNYNRIIDKVDYGLFTLGVDHL